MTKATDLVARIEKAFNEGDVDIFADCFTADAVQNHPLLGRLEGREAIRAAEGAMFAAFDEITLTATRVIEQGDWICAEMDVSARNCAPIAMPEGEVPATGKTVNLSMASVMRVDADGQIVEAYRYQDNLAFLKQLGLA